MKKIYLILLALVALVMPAMAQFDSAPAFPGAEGYGRFTTGGRGGKVYHVTNLNDAGEGSLRAAVEASGKRIIVFDVDGTIKLTKRLNITNGDITILGQTAPGQGICLADYPLYINTNNVIIRYIRCRLGAIIDDDAMNSAHHDDDVKKNIIIDHCTMSWSTDEVGSFYGNENFTLQWCMLYEALRNNGVKDGTHGFGGIWGGKKATFHHNLLAHNDSRNPRFDHGYVSTLAGPVDYVNNVVYNWGGNSAYGGENNQGCEAKKFNMINNFYKPGPASKAKTRLLNPTITCGNCTGTPVPGQFYINGNYITSSTAISGSNVSSSGITVSDMDFTTWKSTCVSTTPFKTDEAKFQYNLINMHLAQKAYVKVKDYAGCSFNRDSRDKAIVDNVNLGNATTTGSAGSTNGLIDAVADAGGYPTLAKGTPKVDTDGDGMPDEWEIAHGLNPNKNDAALYNLDSRRYYTNIEVYANSLVEDVMKAQAEGALANSSFEEYYPDYQNGETGEPDSGEGEGGDDTPAEGTSVLYYYDESNPAEVVNGLSTIVFEDGATLVLNKTTKNYGPGVKLSFHGSNIKPIKLSNGAQNIFTAPEGKLVEKVTFTSYVNSTDEATSIWKEVAGQTYTATQSGVKVMQCIYDGVEMSGELDVNTYELNNLSSFTFNNGGKQVCTFIEVTYYNPTAKAEVKAAKKVTDDKFYNTAGVQVGKDAKGIIICNSKKGLK